ncbi:MAG: hypothetical protein KC560_10420, partial [Myxococcales bacterium]|nr:hypothetical protein [Myxococcales bacterium]
EGVPRARVGATTLERGGRVRLRLDRRRNDPYACLLDGRPAVIERIHRGYDDRVYLAVTLEDDPGQSLFRESGRFLWFFPDEVEVLDT